MITAAILIGLYLIGYMLCYAMLKVEHVSERNAYTIGDRLLACVLSLLSWLWILFMLIAAWLKKISVTGYWDKPLKSEPKPDNE